MKLALMRRDRSAASVPRGSFKRTAFVWRICHWVSKCTLKVYTGDGEVLFSRDVMIVSHNLLSRHLVMLCHKQELRM